MVIVGAFLPWISGTQSGGGPTHLSASGWQLLPGHSGYFPLLNPISYPQTILAGGVFLLVLGVLGLLRPTRIGATATMVVASALGAIGAYTAGTMVGSGLLVAGFASSDVSFVIGVGMWLILGGVAMVLAGTAITLLTRIGSTGGARPLG